MTKAILVLEDSTIFEGIAIGAVDEIKYTCGEVVFNTSITGYQEIISDPSYCKQIIMFTQPHIGNVGVNDYDFESNQNNHIWSNGIIIKSLSKTESNWRSQNSLNNYLISNNKIGIANIDTRALTNLIRTKGALKGCIHLVDDNNKLEQIKNTALKYTTELPSLENQDLAKVVTTEKAYNYQSSEFIDYYFADIKDLINNIDSETNKTASKTNHIVVYDFGVKQNILKLLFKRNCRVTVVPASTSAKDILELKPDGVLLSNGPGDPAACDYAIENTRVLLKSLVPVFGICLGFQILAIALGAKTKKMKFGHHGGNHPVKDLKTTKVMITSQNHGFMVDDANLDQNLTVTHRSLFDNTVQGLEHKKLSAFGFQGHPEASPGPNDIELLFDKFINNILEKNNKKILSESENSTEAAS